MPTVYQFPNILFASTEVHRFTQVNTPTIFITEVQRTDVYRYEGVDLNHYKQVMDSYTYNVFINFVGRLDVEMFEDDFNVYYPEE